MADEVEQVLPDDQQEGPEDLNLVQDWFVGPTLWSTDWTTETIISQLRRGNINLNPRYQRRNAWDSVRKSLFIESLILGLPIPQIILAEEKGKKGRFIVIDGKQRLLAIRQFASDPDETDFPQLKLTSLLDREELNGVTYAGLRKRPDLAEELNSFENQTVRTVVIRGWSNEKYLYSVFLRINTGSVQLSPQELRQALHPGPFSDYIDDYSMKSEAVRNALKLKEPDFRMRDVELVLRYFSYRNFISTYNGDLKQFFDKTTEHFNESWDRTEPVVRSQGDDFEAALQATREIFGERDELRKWNGKTYEKPINRAVFDVMAYFFSDDTIRLAAIANAPAVKAGFEKLCVSDRAFTSALEATTKSIEANRTRFSKWAETLSNAISIFVPSPL